jgi:hypothetical protein
MINKKYFDKLYSIKPLTIAADLSECSLEQALIQQKFKLEDESKYTLLVGRHLLSEIMLIKSGYNLFRISIELQEDLVDEWYLVNELTKTIIYSPGA